MVFRFGFNILLDGVGSKKELMQRFCQLHLSNSFYVELLGYHHDFNTKNVTKLDIFKALEQGKLLFTMLLFLYFVFKLLKNIISDVLELTDNYKTVDEQLHAINEHLRTFILSLIFIKLLNFISKISISSKIGFDLFIIVHNIDGNNMREASIQNMLGELSANKHVHLVASIDHINSSLCMVIFCFVLFIFGLAWHWYLNETSLGTDSMG